MNRDLRRKFLWSLIFALLIYMGIAIYSDWQKLTTELNRFPWIWLPIALGLTLVNYFGRLLKWHWYLHVLNVPISFYDSTRTFGIGMLMVMTPGKVGEFLKSYMVKNLTNTPVSATAPIVLAERMTDGAAMLLLASVGLFAFPNPEARLIAALVFGSFLVTVIIIQTRPVALWLLAIGEKLPLIKRFAAHLHEFYESSYILLNPRNLFVSLLIGTISWLAEGLAYYVILLGVGLEAGLQSMLIAVFIFCISTVIGAVFATPGGLGGVEGSLIALSTQILALSTASAVAAALLVRFCTLWFGVSLGLISFLAWPQLLGDNEENSQLTTGESYVES